MCCAQFLRAKNEVWSVFSKTMCAVHVHTSYYREQEEQKQKVQLNGRKKGRENILMSEGIEFAGIFSALPPPPRQTIVPRVKKENICEWGEEAEGRGGEKRRVIEAEVEEEWGRAKVGRRRRREKFGRLLRFWHRKKGKGRRGTNLLFPSSGGRGRKRRKRGRPGHKWPALLLRLLFRFPVSQAFGIGNSPNLSRAPVCGEVQAAKKSGLLIKGPLLSGRVGLVFALHST